MLAIGTITRRNHDGRRKRGGAISNFYIHYEVDDDELGGSGAQPRGLWRRRRELVALARAGRRVSIVVS